MGIKHHPLRFDQYRETVMHIFIQWLTNKDLLVLWMDNTLSYLNGSPGSEELLVECYTEGPLEWSFTWRTTPQGHDYWDQLNEMWLETYELLEERL